MKLYTSPDGQTFVLDNVRFIGTVEQLNIPVRPSELDHPKFRFMIDTWQVVCDDIDTQNTERQKVINLLNT